VAGPGAAESRAQTPVLRGVHVVLRPVADTDVPALEAILREPEVRRWWMRDTWDRVDEEGSTVFTILVEGAVVGCIEYAEETDPDYRHAGVDLFVSGSVQGRGIGTDALRTILTYLIEGLGHHRVIIDPAVENERAIHVYEKLGFRRVGAMRQYERGADGQWHDGLLMELLAGELVR
jgi:aminoglycoside 6'-N-acetyltransferase